jgi:hypothetical protein
MEQDISTMMKLTKEYFDDELDDKRQEYEVVLEDVKVLNPLHIVLSSLTIICSWVNGFYILHHIPVANSMSLFLTFKLI